MSSNLQQFFSLMTLTFLRITGQLFHIMSLSLGLSSFAWLDEGFAVLGRISQKLMCPPWCIYQGVCTWCQYILLVMLTLITWLRWNLPGFSSVNLLFFFFVIPKYFEEDTLRVCRYLLSIIKHMFLNWDIIHVSKIYYLKVVSGFSGF